MSDPEMRKVYDTKGKEGVDKFKAEKNAPKQQNPFGMFGFQQSDTPRGPDFEVDLEVTLRDLYEGRQFSLTQRKQNTCSQCRGTGARSEADIHTCPSKSLLSSLEILQPPNTNQTAADELNPPVFRFPFPSHSTLSLELMWVQNARARAS